MPTGYTHAIKDGISFRDFALSCARNFGALISMRDESMDAPIPTEIKPSTHYAEALAEARAELERLSALSFDEWHALSLQEYQQKRARHEQRKQENAELRKKYQVMLQQVEAWQPPTPEHEGMKKFMREQIEDSMRFDCIDGPEPEPVLSDDWCSKRLTEAARKVAYYTNEHAKEVKRCQERTAWIQALMGSLPKGG